MTAAPDRQTKWIYRGDMYEKLPEDLLWQEQDHGALEDSLLQRKGLVKVTASSQGTEVVWPLFAANWASLFRVLEWLPTAPAPYKLKYFIVGWAEETFATHVEAAERMSQLISKSDVHLTTRTFVKDIDPANRRLPDVLNQVWMDGVAVPDLSVDCVLDEDTGRFNVERIGVDSTLAKMWGLSPVSYPCRTGHSFAQMVSRAYSKVVKTGEPHYDHIYAALESQEREVFWLPYQRVVLPHRFPDRRKGVTVVTAVADVDISIV